MLAANNSDCSHVSPHITAPEQRVVLHLALASEDATVIFPQPNTNSDHDKSRPTTTTTPSSGMDADSVRSWLANIPDSESDNTIIKRKRDHETPVDAENISPNNTMSNQKRPRLQDVVDEGRTPGAMSDGLPSAVMGPPQQLQSSATSRGESSQTSGSKSARRQLASAALGPRPIIQRRITDATGRLGVLASSIEDVGSGMTTGIISAKERSAIEEAFRDPSNRLKTLPPGHYYGDPEERLKVGPTPSVAEILSITHEATLCQEQDLTEHGWNCAVHFPLLRLALHGSTRRRKQLLDFIPWYGPSSPPVLCF